MFVQTLSAVDNPPRASRALLIPVTAAFDTRDAAPRRRLAARARLAARLEVRPPSIEEEIARWVNRNPPQLYRGGA